MTEQPSLDTALLNIIEKSSLSLSTREISFKLRSHNFSVPDYQVSKTLRKLLGSGQLVFQKNKWSASKNDSIGDSQLIPPRTIIPPPPSPELEKILEEVGVDQRTTDIDKGVIESSKGDQERSMNRPGVVGGSKL